MRLYRLGNTVLSKELPSIFKATANSKIEYLGIKDNISNTGDRICSYLSPKRNMPDILKLEWGYLGPSQTSMTERLCENS